MKKKNIIILVIIVVVLIAFIVDTRIINKKDDVQQPETSQTEPQKEWQEMTYEERSVFLNELISSKKLEPADTELKKRLRVLIADECKNPSTVKFTLQPSIYNGFANVVEADSAWIYTPFKGTAKNDFGVDKEIAGSVMYQYIPESNMLTIKKWDMNQNN